MSSSTEAGGGDEPGETADASKQCEGFRGRRLREGGNRAVGTEDGTCDEHGVSPTTDESRATDQKLTLCSAGAPGTQ